MTLRTLALSLALITSPLVAHADLLEVGDTFPAWTLEAHNGSKVLSSELEGKVYLLFFYPMADTPGCTVEACAFRDRWKLLGASGVQVYGVSFDAPETNAAFANKNALPFLLLSDTGGGLALQVGAASEGAKWANRISYLIGADGRVRSVYGSVDPTSHADEVVEDAKN